MGRLPLRRFDELTPRETQVLILVTEGKSNMEIAAELIIQPSTLERHLTHIYQKLGVSNKTQAAIYALSNGIVTPEKSRHAHYGGRDHAIPN